MDPTSSPDNARPSRGLARFWPALRDEDDETRADETPAEPVARSSDTEMVALGSRQAGSFELGPDTPAGFGQRPAGSPIVPVASAANPGRGPDNPQPPREQPPGRPSPAGGSGLTGGPAASPPGESGRPLPSGGAQHEPGDRDPDHSGASEPGEEAAQALESSRSNPWERDFGGFGLGGRNGRFLFGGRNPAEQRPAVNGHGAETNGRLTLPDAGASTVDDPALGLTAHRAGDSDENGRDDMNGRAGLPGFPTTGEGFGTPGESGPADESGKAAAGRRRDLGDPPAAESRRQTAGWASVPTSTNRVVSPTSGPPPAPTSAAPSAAAPTSAAPTSAAPASAAPPSKAAAATPASPVTPAAPVSGSLGQPPSYVPALPDPSAGPVSGVPAPRTGVTIPVPAPAPAGRAATPQKADPPADKPAESNAGQVSITFGSPTPATAPVSPAATEPRRSWADESPLQAPAPRRSASLEDAEPARRGRRAAPEEPATEDAPLRPGDVAAGNIAFWDDDATRHFRAAWHEVKAEFVDDPVTALTRAHDLLTEAVNELTEAMLAERDELDPLRGSSTPDTESMRMAMRGYREFLERILAL